MKFGMPTLVQYTSIAENVQLCKKLGLDFIELNMNLPICIPENLSFSEIRTYQEQYGVEFTIHLPEELDVSSYHPSIRKGHLERCRQAMEWAHLSGIQTLNMHMNNGIYFTLPQTKVWINEQYETNFRELLQDSYAEFYQIAAAYDVALCIENTGNFQLPYIRKALDQLSAFDNFYLTWDVGHDAKAGFAEESFFAHYNNRIHHMHLHDYNGKSDHQALYTGIVPINDRLEFARTHDCSVVIEVKTSDSLAQSVASLRGNGFL
ncbi:sugar phosphate isomerase/epimerase [Paenibacillus sp. WQ 127069]|uniref:Sugar phosphate isomerase/epimerase n=1 Tax=Paenibacillus baimaensis TaxID=2982185 RepID=A0ABT2UK38_9BACL|nr:sugar phosphate isomerase/epimerase [Paenibacillus sp. WQ 127069]MCU6795001.1 sugar phosphate isomerase/epimerase [Paenibacillus sp. WQ 127069]